MPHSLLQKTIESAWQDRANITPNTKGDIAGAVMESLNLLDEGKLRVAEKTATGWHTHQWLKMAVLLSFRLQPNGLISGSADGGHWFDRVKSKWV
ncbi:MAG: 2,3,4,5-tetrahydropyridine-2,6-dicarboxylate N-succinyltransferase, partial [Alphaproteobacteria bacterium]|nr:2,3,4,5-tetrahydropyridine-2,6-dicarboxylate N-succinyltransferase [Alphaproteobacteria bacterium]